MDVTTGNDWVGRALPKLVKNLFSAKAKGNDIRR